jgi:hypothetical protein
MNNEPVAWTDGNGHYFDKNSFFPADDLIPLYTHPAKTLTDEEIENIYWSLDSTGYDGTFSFIDFARAILKKASKK